MGEDWITSSAIATLFATMVSVRYNHRVRTKEEKEKRHATLFYPLLFASNGIIQVIKNNEQLSNEHISYIFRSSTAILNDIAFKSGSIVYLQCENLEKFESVLNIVNKNSNFFENLSNNEFRNILKNKIESKEFFTLLNDVVFLKDLCEKKMKK